MIHLADRLKRAWARADRHNITLLSAGIAFYAFLAMVPLFASAILTYGLVADPQTVADHIVSLAATLPESAATLVGDQMKAVVETRGGAKGIALVGALALALFGARSGALAIITGLNIAFQVDRSRGAIRANLLALAITAGAVLGFGVVAASSALTAYLDGGMAGLGSFTIVLLAGFGGAALLYRIAPNKPAPSWPAVVRGAALFGVGWMAASAAFGYYAANLGNYNATYGSLGAVIVLLTWLFLTAFLLLFGACFAAVGVAKADH